MTGTQHCAQILIGWDGVLWTVSLGWPQIIIHLLSQVARILGVNHLWKAYMTYFVYKKKLFTLVKVLKKCSEWPQMKN
jgi:hypothetical protein